MQETWVRSLGWEGPSGGGHGNPLQHSGLKSPHGQRSLVGYSPWCCKKEDTTEQLSPHMPGKIVEDREGWDAAVHGVTELGTV